MAKSIYSKTVENQTAVALQPRDFEILENVFDSRFTTIRHAAAIHFNGSVDAAKRRLRRLAGAGLLRAQRSGLQSPSVIYRLAPRALHLLMESTRGASGTSPSRHPVKANSVQQRRMTNPIRPGRLAHELAMLDVKAILQPAIDAVPHLRVHEFGTWPERYAFNAHSSSRTKTKKPDGFLQVLEHWPRQERPNDVYHYIEVDRGSEARDVVVEKLDAYEHHLRSGMFARRTGWSLARGLRPKFRVLLIVESPDSLRRCLTLMESIAARRPHDTLTRATTLDELRRNPLGDIWLDAESMRKAGRSVPLARRALFRNLSTVLGAPGDGLPVLQ
jgi:hypothetical protein